MLWAAWDGDRAGIPVVLSSAAGLCSQQREETKGDGMHVCH